MLTIEPPVDNTTKTLDLLKFAWSKYDAKKVQTRRKSKADNDKCGICIPNFLNCVVFNVSFFQNIYF